MGRDQMKPGEVEALVNELEAKMARLRSIYEQYFMGIERTPPSTARKEVVRLLRQVEGVYVRNTATKFRIRGLVQRFNSYKAYWNRVERQIEEGTYARDIRRAQRNQGRRDRQAARREGRDDDGIIEVDFEDVADLEDIQAELERMDAAGDFDRGPNEPRQPTGQVDPQEAERRKQAKLAEIAGQLGIDQSSGGSSPSPSSGGSSASDIRGVPASGSGGQQGGGGSPATSVADRRKKLLEMKQRMQARQGGSGARQARTSSGGGGGDDARRVYNQLLEAKKRCNESTKGLSYEAVSKSMAKQRESLRQKKGARDVDFKVVIKDGKAFLKPETK